MISTTFHFSMHHFFKEKYEYFLCSLAYIIVYNYGKLEIYMKNKYTNFINVSSIEYIIDNIEDFYRLLNTSNTELITNNEVVGRTTLKKIMNNQNIFLNNDIIIYTEKCKKTIDKKVILNDVPYYDAAYLDTNYEICDYKFLSLALYDKTLTDKSSSYEITLVNKNETFFVVNNRINATLISYLLKKQHNVDINSYFIKYNIQIIDNNVNFINITEKEEIILLKGEYKIVPYDYFEVKRARYSRLIGRIFNESDNELKTKFVESDDEKMKTKSESESENIDNKELSSDENSENKNSEDSDIIDYTWSNKEEEYDL